MARDKEMERNKIYMKIDQLERRRLRLLKAVAPLHADLGRQWKPDQTMEMTSGKFCFGLPFEIAQAEKYGEAMNFETAFEKTSSHGTVPLTVSARNGTWNAYKLLGKGQCPSTCKPIVIDAGWFLCHNTMEDPVFELRQMIYNTFPCDNGGNDVTQCNVRTEPFHKELNYILLGRYLFGDTLTLDDATMKRELDVGICVVDYKDSKESPKHWSNAIRGMSTGGDSNVGRLKYDKCGKCEAFFITGSCVEFQETVFHRGTEPLGHYEWEPGLPSTPDIVAEKTESNHRITDFFNTATS
ncbi:MAG: hypothetical protein SGBAC_012417 [Bacillariaceae sp.]